ncbi:hypothetical protein UVI_02020250 [Ustilaginoidea virens]|uniref:Xylanolytic transcriptional activator regulatory domain-containing protein n=1 Tax=Ustilaginoidea virens TaxID=1159556 RepID=A0A1B5L3Q5_USTVR|nr:hypothetical protein UVI_02020250 [Ustilaginoidea virens]
MSYITHANQVAFPQRKTRCDPTLPRCLPCERSGSTCEYLDTAKGQKINRYYVIKLQGRVRALEAELAQFTDDESDYPRTAEDMVRPGGMIRLRASDETSRYLGPSSGIAMTRLLMEEAKRYTASNRISDLIPEIRAQSQARMQSIQFTGPPSGRKKSYPMISERPATGLPSRATMDKLIQLFIKKSVAAQTFWPVLHEPSFRQDMEAVYNGDKDPYKNFALRIVIAISLHLCDPQYAGLADGYYLSAMQYAEAVIRPKDLKTLQCLVLIGHYSLLTPARTPVYYVLGLAARICQQEGLTDEKTISASYNTDAKAIDMRRRLVWIVAMLDFELSYHMGRPSGFATGNDRLDVTLFADVDDEYITTSGMAAGPSSERKCVALHYIKSREIQAEIKRTLYEQKQPEPNNDSHPWYASIEKRLQTWLDTAPPNPPWSPPCSKHVISSMQKQLDHGFSSATWVFLLTLTSSLNVLLWCTSYAEVRQLHPRQEVEDLVNMALACLDKCVERWPGTAYTSQLYAIISKACLQSYERGSSSSRALFSFASPPSVPEPPQSSPDAYPHPGAPQDQMPFMSPPQFGFVFDSPSESMNAYTFDPNYLPPQPSFRSNSIFCNPATDSSGRRFSYFPPEGSPEDAVQAATSAAAAAAADAAAPPDHGTPSSMDHGLKQMPTPPESLAPGSVSAGTTLSSPAPLSLRPPALSDASSSSAPRVVPTHDHVASPPPPVAAEFAPTPRPSVPQRSLPMASSTADWFSPPAPFISPYNFGPMSSGGGGGGGSTTSTSTSTSFFNGALPNGFAATPAAAHLGGLQNLATGFDVQAHYGFLPGRQGSLTQSQQVELMNALETEGVGDIDAFLSATHSMADVRWF